MSDQEVNNNNNNNNQLLDDEDVESSTTANTNAAVVDAVPPHQPTATTNTTTTTVQPPSFADLQDPDYQAPTTTQEDEEDELAALLGDDQTTSNNNNNENDAAIANTTTEDNNDELAKAAVEQFVEDQSHQEQHEDLPLNNATTQESSSYQPKSRFPLPEGTTLESLFGPHFKPRSSDNNNNILSNIVDPQEVDISTIIQEQFGIDDWTSLAFLPFPGEQERVLDPNFLVFNEAEGAGKRFVEDELEAHILEQEGLIARDEVAELFGDVAVKTVIEALTKGTGGQATEIISLPRPPKAKLVSDEDRKLKQTDAAEQQDEESWLLHLPTIYPNRRSAHIDRGPYVPGHTQVKKPSTSRSIFTPLNVLRWAFDETRDVALSNARLVKWSSGAWSLHIGTDVYAIAPDKTQSLVVVGQEIENTAAEFAPAGVEDANRIFVETAPYSRRVQLLPSAGDGGDHSVENFLVAENRISAYKNQPTNVVKLVTAPVTVNKPPVPGQPKDKNANRIEGSEELAEFIAMQDKERERILREAHKGDGKATSFFDRLAYDAEVLDKVTKAQQGDTGEFSDLLSKFKAEVAAATAASTRNNHQFGDFSDGAQNNNNKKSGGNKLDRRGVMDEYDAAQQQEEDEEGGLFDHLQQQQQPGQDDEDESSKLLSSGTRRTREGEEVTAAEAGEGETSTSSDTLSKEGILDQLKTMKTNANIPSALVGEIDGLIEYITQNGDDMSAETMAKELNELEDKVMDSVLKKTDPPASQEE